jgi:hypothetical protein
MANRTRSSPISSINDIYDTSKFVAGQEDWLSLKASIYGLSVWEKLFKRVSKSDVEATCRKLLGVSTSSEVRNSDGFTGTWTPSVETDVNNYIAKLGSTKKFGPCA